MKPSLSNFYESTPLMAVKNTILLRFSIRTRQGLLSDNIKYAIDDDRNENQIGAQILNDKRRRPISSFIQISQSRARGFAHSVLPYARSIPSSKTLPEVDAVLERVRQLSRGAN
jgi:hypothetical protein